MAIGLRARRKGKPARPAEVQEHWNRVAELGCIVTGAEHPTLHHVHAGSIADYGIEKGMGRKTSDWLVIPLAHELHVGAEGIDTGVGVRTWERRWGSQLHYLYRVAQLTGVDVFANAGFQMPAEEPPLYPVDAD